MNKNQIFIKTGTEYKKITKELLEESNLAELIGDKDKMVGIKPNMVSASDPSNGATTHTEIIAGILEYLKEHGFHRMMILEGSWVGDRTSDVFEVCGYQPHTSINGAWLFQQLRGKPGFEHRTERKDCGNPPAGYQN